MDRVFMLHSGIKGYIRPYWELLAGETDPLMERIKSGEVEEAGVVVALPALPPAWAPGRFFALFSIGDENKFEWKEVTKQIQHDMEAGIEACPDWLKPKYREIAQLAR